MADPMYCFYYKEEWGTCLHMSLAVFGQTLEQCDDLRAMGRCPLKRKTNFVRKR